MKENNITAVGISKVLFIYWISAASDMQLPTFTSHLQKSLKEKFNPLVLVK